MKNLAILGPGLLGGSLALAARARGVHVAVWARRETAVEEVRRAGVADFASPDLGAVVAGADTIVLCVPVGAMPVLAAQIAPLVEPDALITDVGSVKAPVVEALAPIFKERGRFIGSHPMAGSEQSGLAAARADLFDGAVCILTPHEGIHPNALETVAAFWQIFGCQVRMLSPVEHDETVGLVSHLPHLLAAVLVDFVCAENPNSVKFCGNGFRDTTRVASGPPSMWTEILLSNRTALSGQIERFAARLHAVARDVAGADESTMGTLLSNARDSRNLINKTNRNG